MISGVKWNSSGEKWGKVGDIHNLVDNLKKMGTLYSSSLK